MAQLLIKGTKVAEVVGDTTSLIANTLYHTNGTQIISDDGGTVGLTNDVNINNALASATFPIGHLIKTTYYPIIRGTYTNTNFPMDDTVPQITEGVQIFSQAYTPSSAASNILIRAYLVVGETSNVGDTGLVGLFIDSQTDVLRMGWSAASGVADHMTTSTPIYIEHLMNSWTGSRTLSLRMGGHMHAVNYYPADNYNWPTTYFGIASRTSFIVQEFS